MNVVNKLRRQSWTKDRGKILKRRNMEDERVSEEKQKVKKGV